MRADEAGQAVEEERTAHRTASRAGQRGRDGRIRAVSPARLTPAVRWEGFSPFPDPLNPLINRGTSDRQDGRGRGASPLDPAAFWQTPRNEASALSRKASEEQGHAQDSARHAPHGDVRQRTPERNTAADGHGQKQEQGHGDRASRSELQRRLADARRGHSHPLPGVLAGNMVGVSSKGTDTAIGFGTGRTDRTIMTGRTSRTGRTAATVRRTGYGRSGGGVPAGAVRTAGRDRRTARRGTGNRKLYVITPHTGELARLMSSLSEGAVSRGEIESDRRGWAQKAADRLGCVVVLKGAHTYVAAPGAALLEVVAPTYWLSTAGTGDVLAGTLGTVLAQLHGDIVDGRTDLQHAVALGVYLHGYAGGIASGVIPAVCPHPLTSEPLGMAGGSELMGHPLLAMDVASALPSAVHAVLEAAGSMGPALPPRR